MILESAQMLSTVNGGPLKPTHVNHPCTKWLSEAPGNYTWLWLMMGQLLFEYTERYAKVHAYDGEMLDELCHSYSDDQTPFVQCMPDAYKQRDSVKAYRAYYLGEKAYFARWRNGAPRWWKPENKSP